MAPIALVGVAAAASLAGAGVSAHAQMQAGAARRDAARAQAEANRKQAEEVIRRSKINVQRAKVDAEDLQKQQLSGFAASGVELSGSALVFLEEQAARARQDIAEIQISARQKAQNIIAGADATELQGQREAAAAETAAFGTILGGIGGAAGGIAGGMGK